MPKESASREAARENVRAALAGGRHRAQLMDAKVTKPDKPRVLVVDDTPANRYAVTRTLTAAGFEVLEAELRRAGAASSRAPSGPSSSCST